MRIELVKRSLFLGFTLFASLAQASPLLAQRSSLGKVSSGLAGQVVDHTNNHGRDCRIWSQALGERRNLYVYLPPNFDPGKRYPILVWLHGMAQDERDFLTEGLP